MQLEEVIKRFKEHQRKIRAYDHALGLLRYDSRTIAPRNNTKGVSATLSVLNEDSYKLSVDEGFIADIDTLVAHKDELDEQTRREAEFLYKSISRMRKIPMEVYVGQKVCKSESESAWHKAKEANDYAAFEPYLAKMIEYEKTIAKCTAPEMNPYDAMLNNYEEGLSTEVLDNYFATVREKLVPLIKKIAASPVEIRDDFTTRSFPIWKQKQLAEYLMDVMTVDKGRCIIGETEHPFTAHFNKYDVRITTKYKENRMASNIFSVIHESGHALYELNLSDDLFGTCLADGTSMGIHESQSRFYENYIGRSRAFINYLFPKLVELFPEQLGDVTAEEFYLAVNKSQPSLIRIEADELTYSLHILIRYELEKKIMNDELTTAELPEAWNKLYEEYLGVCPPNNAQGILQDTHWASGLFGYFPSYSIGSAYSAQILSVLEKEMDVWGHVAKGDLAPIVAWLTEHIYQYGSARKPAEVLENCLHAPFDPHFYTDYLEKKFTEIYQL